MYSVLFGGHFRNIFYKCLNFKVWQILKTNLISELFVVKNSKPWKKINSFDSLTFFVFFALYIVVGSVELFRAFINEVLQVIKIMEVLLTIIIVSYLEFWHCVRSSTIGKLEIIHFNILVNVILHFKSICSYLRDDCTGSVILL